MKADSDTARVPRISWTPLLLALPVLCLVVMAIVFFSRDRAAARELQQKIGGKGAADARMAASFAEVASKDGTATWSKIIALSNYDAWGWSADLPIVGNTELPERLGPGVEWTQEPFVASFLSEMRPVIDLIHASRDLPRPVWQPIDFNGVGTLLPELQDSRSIVRLLQLDALHAIHSGDAERALAAIESIRTTAEVFDWHLYLVGEFVHNALLQIQHATVGDALQVDIWSDEQLAQLSSLVDAPIPVEDIWRQAFTAEAAMISDAMLDLSSFGWVVPGNLLRFIERIEEIKHLGKGPVGELSKRARAWDVRNGPNQDSARDRALAQTLAPAIESIAKSLQQTEYLRRLAYTSVAVKRYQRKNGAWPETLSELSDVGLKPEDWTIPDVGPLGYRVDSDQATVIYAVGQQPNQTLEAPPKIVSGALYEVITIR